MSEDKEGFKNFSEIFTNKQSKKPPAYPWQDLALRIIKDLNVPNFKRNSVFKVCKTKTPQVIQQALVDTKELCKKGEKWKYFFKVVEGGKNK
jgi:hypothetical protein